MIRIISLIAILAASGLVATTTVSATSVKLHQSISPLDCTVTEINNGSGTSANSDCAPQRPVIESINVNGGRPIIRGLFDAATTLTLRVLFADKWYTLGVDPELTASGNVWTLDLSHRKSPFAPGTYQIVVQARSMDGALYTDSDQLTIKGPASPSREPVSSGKETPSPAGHQSNSVFVVVGVAVAIAATTVGLLVVARRRRTE